MRSVRASALRLLSSLSVLSLAVSAQPPKKPISQQLSRAVQSQLLRLPLAFEADRESPASHDFVSHGPVYTMRLFPGSVNFAFTRTAVLTHRSDDLEQLSRSISQTYQFQMDFSGANSQARPFNASTLKATSNYLVGKKTDWVIGVPMYGRVGYRNLYPGVDVAFYGTQGLIEYDLTIHPKADLPRVRLKLKGADSVHLNQSGDLVATIAGNDFTFRKPVAYQQSSKHRRPVYAEYVKLARDSYGFRLGKYDRTRDVIIDPVLAFGTVSSPNQPSLQYSTAWGDSNIYLAADSSGLYIARNDCGTMLVPTTTGALNTVPSSTAPFDCQVQVSKLDPNDSSLIYSTYISGSAPNDAVGGIAVDTAGNVVLAGATGDSTFPQVGAGTPFTFTNTSQHAFMTKLNATGTGLIYSTIWGGGGFDVPESLVIDHNGSAVTAGQSNSVTFPLVTSARSPIAAVYRTTDGGATWAVSSNGLGSTDIRQFAVDPNNPSTVYAVDTNNGHIAKSVDESQNWSLLTIPGMQQPRAVAVDPNNSSILYVGSFTTGLFKSTDGGATWAAMNNGLALPQSYFQQFGDNGLNILSIAVDPANSNNVFVGTEHGVYRSTDGANTWAQATTDTTLFDYSFDDTLVDQIIIANGKIYAPFFGNGNLTPGLFISSDGGLTWTLSGFQNYGGHEVAVSGSTVIVAANSGLWLSTDGATTFTRQRSGQAWGVRQQPGSATTFYSSGPSGFVAVSNDSGTTWTTITGSNPAGSIRDLMIFTDGSLITGATRYSTFVSRVTSTGALDLSEVDGANSTSFNAEAAVDGSNNIYWSGTTSSSNIATSGAYSSIFNGGNVGFLGSIDGSTGALNWLTYLQGATRSSTFSNGVTADQNGNAWIAGGTFSNSYPLMNPITNTFPGYAEDGVISEFSPTGGLLFSTYLGGSDTTGNGINGEFHSITADANNDIWAAGFISNSGLPMQNALQNFQGGNFNGNTSGMIVELDPSNSILMSTYWGFGNNDNATQVTSDPGGDIYVAGTTNGLPQTSDKALSFFNNSGTGSNAWLIKLANSSLGVSPAVIAFSDQVVGTTSLPQAIVLTNFGSTTVAIKGITTTSEFPITNNCSGGVPPGGSCILNVSFRPASASRTGTGIGINTSAQTAPFQVLVSGGGISTPSLQVIDGSGLLDFGNVATGVVSSPQFVRLYSNGAQPVSISSVSVTSGFTASNNCPAQLTPYSSCTVQVNFAPTQTGFLGGWLTINDNTNNSPHMVSIQGSGLPTPYINVSPGLLDFQNQLLGTTSNVQWVTVSNPGTADAFITPIAVGDFQIVMNECGSDVFAGGSCPIAVAFDPQQVGLRTGALFIFSNAHNGAQRVNLSGIGVAPPQIEYFFASPSPVTAGQSTSLFAAFTQATSGIITQYSSGTSFAISSGGSVTVTPPVAESVQYTLTVSANGSTVIQNLQVPELPATVNALSAAFDYTTNNVILTWPAAPGADYYEVFRSSTSGSGYSYVEFSYSNSVSDFTGATGNFYYVVVAYNNNGQSNISPEASVNVPQLIVTAISPTDGTTLVGSFPLITVSFNHEPFGNLSTNTDGSCTGAIQVSSDNFTTCAPTFGSAFAQFTAGVWTSVSQLSQPLAGNTVYKVKVTGAGDDLGSIAPDFVSLGFSTAPQMAVTGLNPTDGQTGVSATTPIQVQFNLAPDPSTITVNTDNTCSGTMQVSADGFSTCVAMISPPAISGSVVTLQPAAPLNSATQYQIRVTTGVQSIYQSIMPASFTTVTGFGTL